MDVVFVLVPLSVGLVLALLGLLAWAVYSGQLEDVAHEGERILDSEPTRDTAPTTTSDRVL